MVIVTHLKSNYTDILAVDYLSNGKTLNATFWLTSGFDNSSISTYTTSTVQKDHLWNAN